MKIINNIEQIKKDLLVVQNYIENAPKSSEAQQLEWALKHIAYLENKLQQVISKPGRNKSYASTCESTLSHLRGMRRTLDNWQVYGLPPDDYEWKEIKNEPEKRQD